MNFKLIVTKHNLKVCFLYLKQYPSFRLCLDGENLRKHEEEKNRK